MSILLLVPNNDHELLELSYQYAVNSSLSLTVTFNVGFRLISEEPVIGPSFVIVGARLYLHNASALAGADARCHFVALPVVTTNASTGVEETNATLKGFLSSNGGLDTTCGFRFGTSSGIYSENFSVGIITDNTEFSNNNGSLTPGQIYYYQAWASNSLGFVNGSELTFLTKPSILVRNALF